MENQVLSGSPNGIILTDFYAGQPEHHQRALGAYHIASMLRLRGLGIRVIDYVQSLTPAEIDLIVEKCVDESTVFIGLSTTFFYAKMDDLKFERGFESVDPVTRFIARARQINPSIKVFQGGGFHFHTHPLVDFWIPGQYVENKVIEQINANCGLNLPCDYDFTKHRFSFTPEDCIVPGEPLPVEISRGCIFSCKFCSFSGRGKKVNDNIKDFDLLADFLNEANRLHGTSLFYLADDTFNESELKLEKFLSMTRKLNFKPRFCSYIRIDLLMKFPKMLPMLVEAGVTGLTFGIETFHPEAARTIGKPASAEKIKAFLLEIRSNYPELYTGSGFIVGLPHESLESVNETKDWLIQNDALDSWSFKPLVIDNALKNPNPSYFSREIERYGYKRVGELGWERPDISFKEVTEFCLKLANETSHQNGPSPWALFSAMRTRSFEQVRNTKLDNLNSILDTEKFGLYKARLFNSF